MNVRGTATTVLTLVAIAGAVVACGGPQSSVAPSQTAESSAVESGAPVSALEGTWVTAETTCEQQNAALTNAGFTEADLEAGGWDAATCGDTMHGTQFTLRFADDRLVIFQDGEIGWEGLFQVVDADTFEAGDGDAGFYITYAYAVDGDELTVDMVSNEFPTTSEEELTGEMIAQTVIYESAPFVREQ
jgi:hypothetical protein